METLPYEVLVRIACKLDITAIFRFSLATSRRGNILFLEDERLFRMLCSRDYDHDQEKPWSWKESYKSLTIFARYMTERCRQIEENDMTAFMAYKPPETQVMAKFFDEEPDENIDDDTSQLHDNEYFRTVDQSCVESVSDKPLFITEFKDNDDGSDYYKLVDLRNMKLQHCMLVEKLRVYQIIYGEDDPNDGFFARGRQELIILKEGLCRWLRFQTREECGYILFHDNFLARKDKENVEVDKILQRQMAVSYTFSDSKLALQHAGIVWQKMCEEIQRSEMKLISSEFLNPASPNAKLKLILVKNPRWKSLSRCMSFSCTEILAYPYGYKFVGEDESIELIRNSNLCSLHLNTVHPGHISNMLKRRFRDFVEEKKRFVDQSYGPLRGFSMRNEFRIEIRDIQGKTLSLVAQLMDACYI
jgi:hypothetical protein